MPYDDTNILAKILRGELPSHPVYEDDRCLAILDIFPINPGHLLVIPKARASTIADLDPAHAGHLLQVAARLSQVVRAVAPRCEGVNFWISDGTAAGQEIPHVHLHVIPRFAEDGFRLRTGPKNRQPQDPADLAALAGAYRTALAAD
jgi:histidine triad (HIT) family protein